MLYRVSAVQSRDPRGMNMNDAEKDDSLSTPDIERYSRQLLLTPFGISGQRKLNSSRVLVVGLGGLGCPAALYLSGAGVGTLGLVDRPDDVVEASNLHRQIAHSEARVGTCKVNSAEIAIKALNCNVAIEKHDKFVRENAVRLTSSYDLVLDCTDNVASRYLISDACATSRTPLVSGSAIGTDGQLTLYCKTQESPCYRCIFPSPPPPSCVGSCDSAGVLGPVPGVIGTLQALEAIKLLSCMKQTDDLDRKMLLFDGSLCGFRTVKLRSRVKNCAICGDSPQVNVAKFDYDLFANGGMILGATVPDIPLQYRITPQEFEKIRKDASAYRLIDVRPSHEFALCHLNEAENWPLSSLEPSRDISDKAVNNKRIIFLCRRGNASRKALKLFLDAGITNVCDIVGGLQAWHHNVDKGFPLY
ncbi:Adenylyltransferase and sulfurtransferase MOCS3 [Gracilaria domingensis]|nr:Adenylyltransferase and sulfurtransferase MOCS3 [Gracilaria domingensis]